VPELLWVADAVDRANAKLEDPNRAIGPSHFLRKDLTEEWVHRIWRHSIIPYLEEQFFGQEERVEEFTLEQLLMEEPMPLREEPGETAAPPV